MSNFSECLKLVLHHEGGYVNHPKDPGGETNMGVTKRVYEEFGGTKDMKDLEFEDVMQSIKRIIGIELKQMTFPGLDLCVFDFGVNAGTGRAAKYLQSLVGATADGAIGPNTLKTVEVYVQIEGIEATIEAYQKNRQGYYEKLKTFETFGRGWTRRTNETTEAALKMISS